MKITDVKTYIAGNPWKNWVFAQVETDEGIYGVGEGTLNGFAKTVEAAIHELKQFVIGMDPFQVEEISMKLFRDVFSDGGQIHGAALAAIEFGCWDIMGKATGQPVYNLLGGAVHKQLRAYANGWYRGPRTPENYHERAKVVVGRGYTALKFDPFGKAWKAVDREDFALAIDIIAAVRDAVGPDVDVLVEGHNRFSAHTAIQFAQAMAPYRPSWFEAPVPFHNIGDMVEVARQSPVPIACGEDYHTREQFAELLKYDAVHIVQLEPQFMGMSASKQVCGMVHAFNGVTAPHSAQGPICSIACAHLNASTPNFYLHESFDEFNEPWEKEIVTQPLPIKNGFIDLPKGPGWGTDLNLDEIAKHPYQRGNWLPLFRQGWERRDGTEK